MNKKFFYYSLTLASVFLIFVNFVSPEFLWAKIIFFFVIFCFLFSLLCIFSKKYRLNLFISIYLISLILLYFFHQFNWLNFIILTILLITVIFLTHDNNKKYTA
jgi:hypothetical protein